MAWPHTKRVIEYEQRIKTALNVLENKEFNSLYSAAMHFKFFHVTHGWNWKGGKSRVKACESQQLLSSEEEKALAERIYQMTVTGHPPTQDLIHEIAEELRQHWFLDKNDNVIQRVNYEPIRLEWVLWFIKRHPQLKTVYSETIEVSQMKDVA